LSRFGLALFLGYPVCCLLATVEALYYPEFTNCLRWTASSIIRTWVALKSSLIAMVA